MESSRLKNIIILILALTNLCLLGLLATRLITGSAAQAEARDQMVALFAAEGVSLDADLIPDDTPPAGLTLIRDAGEERKLAEFLLGDALIAASTAAAASAASRAAGAAPSSGPTAALTRCHRQRRRGPGPVPGLLPGLPLRRT